MIVLISLLLAFIGFQIYIALQIIRTKQNQPIIFNQTQKFYIHQWMLKKFGSIHTRKD